MPEFEHTKPQADPGHSYTPSTDAKPRSRRRSGGFKTVSETPRNANIGEVDPSELPKERERLSGPQKREERTRGGRDDAKREKRPSARASEASSPQGSETPSSPSRGEEGQPEDATLAAIRRVEERISARKAERQARRREHEAKRSRPEARASGGDRPRAVEPRGGLLCAITGFFGKLLGSGSKTASKTDSKPRSHGPRTGGDRSRSRGGPGDRRDGRNRGQGGNPRSGAQGRRSGGRRRKPQATRNDA